MGILALTTSARVKAFVEVGGKSWTAADTLLSQLITEVSVAIEAYLGRKLLKEERTEDYDLREAQRIVWLNAFPFDLAQTFEVKNDFSREFAASSVVDATGYFRNSRLGCVEFHTYFPVYGPGVLRVKYTGGLAADAAGVVAAYPDLAHAAELQIVYTLQRRAALGANVKSGGGASTSFGEPAMDLLPGVKTLLRPYWRARFGG